ncbi:MAG: MATE family efflux transporter, partial [Ottowia sp.]|nr:MATE family efflux transporter [Ottowia sp.]
DMPRCLRTLWQSCAIALAIALTIVVLQVPLLALSMWVISPSADVVALASDYFRICVWGAPPVLVMMSIKGWLLGMQDSKAAMWLSIVVNVLNIIASLLAVYVLRQGFMGIAVGTLVAEWLGLAYALWVVWRKMRRLGLTRLWGRDTRSFVGARRFFSVSGDILLRSFLLMLVNLFVVAAGARSGDMILAVNSLMQQLNSLFAYFLDGIAFAGEALVGKYYGANNGPRLRLCVRRLFVWAAVLTAAFTVLYSWPQLIFAILTDASDVITAALDYRWWCALLPVAGMAAFVWDGVFIGLTRSRGMLLAVAVADAAFFALYFILPASMGNHRLWLAFVTYLALRGVVQTWLYARYSPVSTSATLK